MISRQHQSVDQSNVVPPPVPPRPNKELLRERLLNVDVKKSVNNQEMLDEKKENRYNDDRTLRSNLVLSFV